MHISFAVFADAANLSQEGKLNVLGIFDALQVGALPTLHPRAHLVVRLKGTMADAGQHTLTFRWMNPQNQELWNSTGDLHLEPAVNPQVDMDLPIIAVIDLPLDVPGTYTMHIDFNKNPMTSVNVHVNGPTQASGGGGPGGMPFPPTGKSGGALPA